MTTVLLADDHSVLRAGLVALLNAEDDLEVVGEAGDGIECIEKVKALRPDVVVLDVNMPRCNGLDALERLHGEAPESRVLVLTMHDDLGYLRRVLAAGGAGYVLKQSAGDDLLTALRTVATGGVFIHPDHARRLANEEPSDAVPGIEGTDPELAARFGTLSEREMQVFELVALGHSNAEIAERAFISVKTVETYKARLGKKLGIEGRAALVRAALDLGILG